MQEGDQRSCLNMFTLRVSLEEYQAKNIAILNTMLMPCILAANLFIVILLRNTKQMKSLRVNNFFFCFAISNCLVASLTQPVITALFTTYSKKIVCLPEVATHFTFFLLNQLSGFTILAIGIDQYMQLRDMQWYKFAMTRKKAIALITIVGFLAVVATISYVIATINAPAYRWVSLFLTSVNFVALASILVGCIVRRGKKRKATREYKRFPTRLPAEHQNEVTDRDNKTPRRILIPTLASTLTCNLIYIIMEANHFHASEGGSAALKPRQLYWLYLSRVFQLFNCFFVAIIFLCNNQSCQEYVKMKLKRKIEIPKYNDVKLSDLVDLV
eukprot:gene20353-22359_t